MNVSIRQIFKKQNDVQGKLKKWLQENVAKNK